jgi:hypothetical protein
MFATMIEDSIFLVCILTKASLYKSSSDKFCVKNPPVVLTVEHSLDLFNRFVRLCLENVGDEVFFYFGHPFLKLLFNIFVRYVTVIEGIVGFNLCVPDNFKKSVEELFPLVIHGTIERSFGVFWCRCFVFFCDYKRPVAVLLKIAEKQGCFVVIIVIAVKQTENDKLMIVEVIIEHLSHDLCIVLHVEFANEIWNLFELFDDEIYVDFSVSLSLLADVNKRSNIHMVDR